MASQDIDCETEFISVIHSPPSCSSRRRWVGGWEIYSHVGSIMSCTVLLKLPDLSVSVGCWYKKLLDDGIKYSCRQLCPYISIFGAVGQTDNGRSASVWVTCPWPMSVWISPENRVAFWSNVVLPCDVAFKDPFTLSVSEWIWIGSVNACVTPDTFASRWIGVPYHVTYPMMHLMLPISPVNRHTPVKTLSSPNFVCSR